MVSIHTYGKKCVFRDLELCEVSLWLNANALVVSKQWLVHIFHFYRTRSNLKTVCIFLFFCFDLYDLTILNLLENTME